MMIAELQYMLTIFMDIASKVLRILRENFFESQKMVRNLGALTVLPSKSRHNGVQILLI